MSVPVAPDTGCGTRTNPGARRLRVVLLVGTLGLPCAVEAQLRPVVSLEATHTALWSDFDEPLQSVGVRVSVGVQHGGWSVSMSAAAVYPGDLGHGLTVALGLVVSPIP